MENTLFQALQRCYCHSSSLVLILDSSWNILWSNRACSDLDDLPEKLGIARDHSGNTVQQFLYHGISHECRLLHNREDGFRIAEIAPIPSPSRTILQMDVDAVTASVQSMTSACHALHAELDRMELYDQTPLLNVMIGNCYRIYRMAYLQKELDRLESGARRNDLFSVNTLLRNTIRKADAILHPSIEIEAELCTDECFLQGDMDEFVIAVLSAVVLCAHGCDHYQQLRIGLTQEDGMVSLQLCAEQTDAALPAELLQGQDIGAGSCEGERAILNTFCSRHNGRWLCSEQPQERTKRCTITFPAAQHDGGTLTLFSPRETQEGRFYNKYEILLSCIRFKRMF